MFRIRDTVGRSRRGGEKQRPSLLRFDTGPISDRFLASSRFAKQRYAIVVANVAKESTGVKLFAFPPLI